MARRKVHWSEVMTCSCGAKFTDYAKEAVHRHNFPALCRKRTVKPVAPKGKPNDDRAPAGKP